MSWLSFLDNEDFIHRPAIKDLKTNRLLTYGELRLEVCKWIYFLKSEGVRPGDKVAYLNTNSLEHLTILFACSKLGVAFVPLNFRQTTEETKEVLNNINPHIVISGEKRELGSDWKIKSLSHIDLNIVEEVSSFDLDPNSNSLILFTSGTSGIPKGVLFHNEMIRTNQLDTCEQWKLIADDSAVIETPFFHTGAYNVFCLPLLNLGGKVILAEKFDTNNFYAIDENKVSVYFGVPTMFQCISEDSRFNSMTLDHIRFVISGGAYCPETLIKKYQKKDILFKQGFGLTEVGPNCFLLNDKDALKKIGSIGRPMGASIVKLINEEGEDVGVNKVGELLIKGRHLCNGFFGKQDLFNSSLSQGYYHTGDLAYVDEEGFFYIAGRKKEMYISGGENVYPAEVERKIQMHPSIDEVVIVSKKDEKWGEVGHAFIRSSKNIEINELREFLNPILSRYKHPHSIEAINTFPLLANGKVDKLELKNMANS